MRSPAARAGIALLCAVGLGRAAAAAAEVDSGSTERVFSFRADPMVLDAAVHGSQVLLFVEAGSRLISAGSDARVLVWSLADDEEGARRRRFPESWWPAGRSIWPRRRQP